MKKQEEIQYIVEYKINKVSSWVHHSIFRKLESAKEMEKEFSARHSKWKVRILTRIITTEVLE